MNARMKWLKSQLLPLNLDGIIISNPTNVKYLTGLSEEGYLIIGNRENMFITDSRYIESVNRNLTIDDEIIAYDSRTLDKYDYENIFFEDENIGFEEKYVTYEQYKKYLQMFQVSLNETDGIIENQRIVKDEEEIEYIKKACEITDEAFKYILDFLEEGITEKEVAFEIEKYMVTHDSDGIAFDLIVAFGENTSMPHAVPTDRRLKKGDIIQFDIGCKFKGYCSDFSRVVFTEEPTDDQKRIYDFLIDQQKKLSIAFRDGANIKQIIKDRENDYKLKNYAVMHAFGHGVGLDIHEQPFLNSKMDNYAKENSVIAIEPGVYLPGEFGMRIEDTYLVEKVGTKQLTTSKKDYIVIDI